MKTFLIIILGYDNFFNVRKCEGESMVEVYNQLIHHAGVKEIVQITLIS